MQIYSDYWVTLPQEVRSKLHEMLALNKSAGTEVVDGQVISDGHTNEDLKAITLEHLQSVLNTTEQNFDSLWLQVLVKAGVIMMSGTVEPMPEEPKEIVKFVSSQEVKKVKKIGAKKKK